MKRLFDILFSSLLIVILSPLISTVALIIYINMGRPIFFVQRRPGLNNCIFKILKFRTMRDTPAAPNVPDSQRTTALGGWLRRTSIDELPELWNILKGEMSFVGPRPLLEEYLLIYSANQKRRHSVRPGLTGLAQINGRNAISWERKFELDLWYVENHNLFLDIKIMITTIVNVLRQKDIAPVDSLDVVKFSDETGKERNK
jgi:lipopolysaccharide/colanic/teichoic acid biosynthesis glycosyltransferase